MSAEPVIGNIHRLSVHVEALAALGAALRLQQSGGDADHQVWSRLLQVIRAIDPQLAEDGALSEGANAAPLIRTVFRQAIELLENPARAPGWRHEDQAILQSQGQVSRHVVHSIDALAELCPSLRAILRRRGTLLDIGTGSAWLAIEAARIWPALRVVGIDVWEPALAIARENVARSQFAGRIELPSLAVEQLDDLSIYTVAFFPGPFIAPDMTREALDRVYRALVPGGWLIFALWGVSSDPLAAAVANLRIVRSGGHPWSPAEVEDLLRVAGFARIEALPNGAEGSPISFVIGQRDNDEEQRIWTS